MVKGPKFFKDTDKKPIRLLQAMLMEEIEADVKGGAAEK